VSRRRPEHNGFPAAFLILALASARLDAQEGPVFEVRFDAATHAGAFDGRVLVFLSKTDPEPRTWNNWARLEPVLAADFLGVEPGETMRLDASNTLSFPVPLRDLEGGRYHAQAVLDVRRDLPSPGLAPGNPCSAPVAIELHGSEPRRVELVCDRPVPAPEIRETRFAHVFQIPSPSLSAFHGHTVLLRALVHLPEAWYAEPDRRFPLHVFLSGFGARLEDFDFVPWPAAPLDGVPMVMLYPDPSCASGYCGFVDSDTNGPYGTAFLEELVPAVEEEYRCFGASQARFLAGHSSGGWSALWLATSHPDAFGYVWACAPDPVDFRDFLGVDLYAEGANLFHGPRGELRPFCQLGNFWTLGFTREYSDREEILRGGVLRSFEALFGPRGADGAPVPLWDRRSGAIDPEVAAAWSRHDLARVLRERWDELGPKLSGKLAVTMGDRDNFLLQGSVRRLERELETLGGDLGVRVLAGDHFTVRSLEETAREQRAMADVFRAWRARTPAVER